MTQELTNSNNLVKGAMDEFIPPMNSSMSCCDGNGDGGVELASQVNALPIPILVPVPRGLKICWVVEEIGCDLGQWQIPPGETKLRWQCLRPTKKTKLVCSTIKF